MYSRSNPGQVGGEKQVKLWSEEALKSGRQGRDRSKVQGGKRYIQKRLKQVGQEPRIKVVKIATEPRYRAVPF